MIYTPCIFCRRNVRTRPFVIDQYFRFHSYSRKVHKDVLDKNIFCQCYDCYQKEVEDELDKEEFYQYWKQTRKTNLHKLFKHYISVLGDINHFNKDQFYIYVKLMLNLPQTHTEMLAIQFDLPGFKEKGIRLYKEMILKDIKEQEDLLRHTDDNNQIPNCRMTAIRSVLQEFHN